MQLKGKSNPLPPASALVCQQRQNIRRRVPLRSANAGQVVVPINLQPITINADRKTIEHQA